MQTTSHGKISIEFYPQPAGIPSPALANSLGPLIDLALSQTGSTGAYIYRTVAGDTASLHLVWWAGPAPTDLGSFRIQVAGAKAIWHTSFDSLVSLPGDASSDWRFQDFPEFLHNHFQAAAAIPLVDHGIIVGRAHFCRREAKAYGPGESSFLSRLSLPIGALLAGTWARAELQSELERVSRKLAERKVVERAKGLLQQRFSWSEEQAYLYLRQNSRIRRVPLAELAQEVISIAASVEGSKDAAA
jgi:hypothetical protein